MDRTTVYLPVELKTALRRLARERGVSEAEIIRDSIRQVIASDRLGTRSIATLDRRHFEVLRPLAGGRFAIVP